MFGWLNALDTIWTPYVLNSQTFATFLAMKWNHIFFREITKNKIKEVPTLPVAEASMEEMEPEIKIKRRRTLRRMDTWNYLMG